MRQAASRNRLRMCGKWYKSLKTMFCRKESCGFAFETGILTVEVDNMRQFFAFWKVGWRIINPRRGLLDCKSSNIGIINPQRGCKSRNIGLVIVALALIASSCGWTDAAKEFTDLSKPAIVGAIAYNYLSGERDTAARAVDSLIVAYSATEILKRVTSEKRPDGSDSYGFPSGHTSGAFAVAGVLAKKDKAHKWIYYGLASGIGWSRVELRKHEWKDVIAGAFLGLQTANWSVSSKDGLLLTRAFKF